MLLGVPPGVVVAGEYDPDVGDGDHEHDPDDHVGDLSVGEQVKAELDVQDQL